MTNKERIQEKISKLTNINSAYETQVSDMTVTNACYFIDRLEDFLEDDEMAKAVDMAQSADGAVLVICFPKAYISLVFKITDTTIFVLLMGPNKEHLIDKFDVLEDYNELVEYIFWSFLQFEPFTEEEYMDRYIKEFEDLKSEFAKI